MLLGFWSSGVGKAAFTLGSGVVLVSGLSGDFFFLVGMGQRGSNFIRRKEACLQDRGIHKFRFSVEMSMSRIGFPVEWAHFWV